MLPTRRLRQSGLQGSQRRITIRIPTGSRHPLERTTWASIVLHQVQFPLRQALRLPRSPTVIHRHQGHRQGPSITPPELMRM